MYERMQWYGQWYRRECRPIGRFRVTLRAKLRQDRAPRVRSTQLSLARDSNPRPLGRFSAARAMPGGGVMRPLAPLVCATLAVFPHPARCMQAPRLEPGARIRFDAPGYTRQ